MAFAVDDGPVELPGDWAQLVHEYFSDSESAQITRSLKRGSPLGDRYWTQATAAKLKLEATLRPRGPLRRKGHCPEIGRGTRPLMPPEILDFFAEKGILK